MNWEQIQGRWRQLTGRAKSAWAKVTDDDAQNVAGKRDVMVGKVQEGYGKLKDHVESRIDHAVTGAPPAGAGADSDRSRASARSGSAVDQHPAGTVASTAPGRPNGGAQP